MSKHLKLKDRVILQYQIEHYREASSFSVARNLNTSYSTIYRELKRNRLAIGSKQRKYLKSIPAPCPKLASFPFVCNRCMHRPQCVKDMFIYDAYEADYQARKTLRVSRYHPNMTTQSIQELNELVSPRVKCHQSLYHILQSDPRIRVSESTLRRYIDRQLLDCRNLDLPRTVRFPHKLTSRKVQRKRINIELLVNRTYQDFQDYTRSTKRVVLQLDTVIGKLSDKKCLLTLYEPTTKFQWGYLIYKSAAAVNRVLADLIQTLRLNQQLFFDCILCDNGGEFQSLPLLETTELGEILTRVFFCDPYASFQKGACERNHSLIRYVIKKGESFDSIHQNEINQLFSHINSHKRKSLSGKNPFKAFSEKFHFNPSDFISVFEVSSSSIKLKK